MKGRYVEPQITSYLFAKAARNHTPVGGTFELSPLCNLDCRMCYVHMTAQQIQDSGLKRMTSEEWIALAQEAKEQGMLYLLLTGGEPFLYPGFRELYEALACMGFIISINTNGTMIDRETVEWLKENPPFRVNVTMYGASPAVYKKLCGRADGYDRFRHGVELLREAGISVKLSCSLTPYNASDLEKMIRFANDRNLIIEVASYMFPAIRRGRDNVGKNERFTPEEAAVQMFRVQKLLYGEETLSQYAENILAGTVPALQDCQEPEPDGTVRCRAGRATFWVTWHGEMRPCGMLERPGVPVRGRSFAGVWKELTELTQQIRMSGQCSRCGSQNICHACAAMALSETGAFEQTPGYLCRMVEALRKEAASCIKSLKE